MNAAIDMEVMNGFTRYLLVEKLDAEMIERAKTIYADYKHQGVILESDFEDDVWILSNQTKRYRFLFEIDHEKYRENTEEWAGCSVECFRDCIKAYTVFRFGLQELSGLQLMIYQIIGIVEQPLDVAVEHSEVRNHVESLLTMLPSSVPALDMLIEKLQEMGIHRSSNGNKRQLADFSIYFQFHEAMSNAWAGFDEQERFFYFPVYFWWNLTAILPLRVTEFLLTPRDCLKRGKNGWMLTIRRTKMKKGTERIKYKIEQDYELYSYDIPDWIADEISRYVASTEKSVQSELGTLFIPIPNRKYKYFTYAQMQNRLNQFSAQVMDKPLSPVKLGDTRHIAMINLILSGGSPVICRELAGHESVDISSNYYSNLACAVESAVYEHYHRGKGDAVFNGRLSFPISRPKNTVKVEDGWCDYPDFLKGDITECSKSYGADSGLGDCRNCVHFYPETRGLLLEIKNARKIELDEDSKFLIQMIDLVRKGKGCQEDIAAVLAKVQGSAQKYASAYNKLMMRENGYGKTKDV